MTGGDERAKGAQSDAGTVAERLEARFRDLTRAERQLAASLLEDYPVAGLSSITSVAQNAGVSTPTVARLVHKLGFSGFGDFQDALREELSEILRKPTEKLGRATTGRNEDRVADHFEALVANLRQTAERLDPAAFEDCVALLADPRRRVRTVGGRLTRVIADHMARHLMVARPRVAHLGPDMELWPQALLDLGAGDILVVFDIRRYEPALLRLAEAAVEQGAEILLYTDQWGSPVASLARRRIHARIDAPSAWDSLVAPMALAEATIAAVQDRLDDRARERLDRLEALMARTRIFGRRG